MAEKFNPVVRPDTLELQSRKVGKSYEANSQRLAPLLKLTQLGCTYLEVPPGKTACPFHVHHGEDEMFVIVSGHGEYRFGDETYPVKVGDILSAPKGSAEYAHQIWNKSDEMLVYLAISSKADIDVCEYPDTGKFLALSNLAANGEPDREFQFIGRKETSLDYFDGDKDV